MSNLTVYLNNLILYLIFLPIVLEQKFLCTCPVQIFSLKGEDLHFWVSGFLELVYMCTFNLIWGKGVYIANIVLNERVRFVVH